MTAQPPSDPVVNKPSVEENTPSDPNGLIALPPADFKVPKNRGKISKPKKVIIISCLLIVISLILSLVSGYIWYKGQLRPVSKSETAYSLVTIEDGQSVKDVSRLLADERLIINRQAFEIYMRFEDKGQIQAGSYRLAAHQSVKEIADMITSGEVSMLDIMIPPGQRLDQIKTILEKAGYDEIEVDDALVKVADHDLIKDLPKSTLLEGYLFPDTYKIAPDTTAEALLRYILDHFQDQITPDITEGLKKQGIPLKDAVILASIVQSEVPDYETQRKVAQVFIKRLKEGVPLGADPTFKYAAIMTDKEASPALDSPYNTRIYAGLPPTAIGNFNISALKAVANPANTKYNYFVAGDDERTHFTYTEEEHIAATKKYCTTLCE